MRTYGTLIGLAGLLLVGCPKKRFGAGTSASASATATTAAAPSASVSAAPESKPTAGGAFAGKYTVSTGTLYVPAAKDWASVKFKNDDSKLLGDGELNLGIDGSGRVVGGTDSGPLGASVIEGSSDGKTLSATVRRKVPSDGGLTGTLVATVGEGTIDGTMSLAEFNAAVVRVATFHATRK